MLMNFGWLTICTKKIVAYLKAVFQILPSGYENHQNAFRKEITNSANNTNNTLQSFI